MFKKRFTSIIILLILSSLYLNVLHAQRIDSLLSIMETKFPQEKIHVQFDKLYYNAGETIWFKAYIAADNLPGAISKTMYADLVDDKGGLLQRKMIPIIHSGAASSFDLPDTMQASRLFLRAYTKWMLNFDSMLIYTKPIQIIPAKNVSKKTVQAITYNVQFFPESGDLVEGISTVVAFKANDNQGIPFHIKGDVTDSKGKKVSSFSAIHDGMGSFELMPLANEKYTATWKDKNGIKHETVLPVSKKQGAVLSVALSGDKLYYTIKRPEEATASFTSFQVVAQMQQREVYSARINMLKKTSVMAPIETENMPNGVLQLTIFNADQIPVAERIVFINHDNYSFITDLHAVEKNMDKRGRTVLQLDVGDNLLTNLSISVTDAGINPVTENEESIYSRFLLSNDLKGTVYNPAYYFSSTDDSVKIFLDLVMMTNGWRRFKWEDVLAEKWPVIKNQPDNLLSINGSVLGLSRTQLYQKDLTGIFKTKNGTVTIYNIPINKEGLFSETGLNFFDTAQLYYSLSNDKDKVLTTAASFSFLSNLTKVPPAGNGLLSSFYQPLYQDSTVLLKNNSMIALLKKQNDFNKVKTLETVLLVRKQKSLKEKMEKEYTSGFFSGGDGYTFTTEDDPFAKSAINVLAYLQGRVAGLQISSVGQGSATWRGSATNIFLNEVNADLNSVQNINMNDVAMIKVFRPPFFGAMGGGAGGAIAIYTKKGGSDNSQVKGLPVALIQGYSSIKQFYMPDYETDPEPNLKDYRTTLYWNPFLIFDKSRRRITLPFFNSDNCKKLRITIEGINEAGMLTREEKIIE